MFDTMSVEIEQLLAKVSKFVMASERPNQCLQIIHYYMVMMKGKWSAFFSAFPP